MCAIIKNPLQRDGTSQQQRMAQILLPENAKIDDRSIEEIISFACEYIKLINYYNTNNQTDPNTGWSCFYESDVCILLAIVTATDTESIEATFKDLEEKITQLLEEKEQGELDDAEAESLTKYYDDIINLIYSIAARIQYTCTRLPNGHALKEEIINIIKNDLRLAIIDNKQQDALIKLIGYDKASTAPVNDYTQFIQKSDSCECTKAWQLNQEGYDCIFPDTSFDLASLKALFYIFFIALLRIKQRAAYYFEDCIKNTDTHEPHITLFLTFLYLFRNATDHLNTLTRAHLLYYYETILCLHKKAATPDKVHVIFELAKNFDTHLVETGTLLNAGKDDSGKQIVFALLEEVVVNKAKVEEVKTVYINEATGIINAAPKANTKDGIEEAFGKAEQVHWRPLGGNDNPDTEIGFALASPMFFLKEGKRSAIISLQLNNEPKIRINTPGIFRFYYSSENGWVEVEHFYTYLDKLLSKYPLLSNLFKVNKEALTALIREGLNLLKTQGYSYDDSWDKILKLIKDSNVLFGEIEKIIDSVNTEKLEIGTELNQAFSELMNLKYVFFDSYDESNNQLDFILLANTTAEPVSLLKKDEEKTDIISEWPIIKALVKNITDDNGNISSQYNFIKDVKITGVDIKAGAYGLKNIIVQNDTAILDNSKEIQPFTNRPYTGSYFYVGSKEAFQKKLGFAGIELTWAGTPGDFADYYANYITSVSNDSFYIAGEYLNNGNFQLLNQAFLPLFFESTENSTLIFGYDNIYEGGPVLGLRKKLKANDDAVRKKNASSKNKLSIFNEAKNPPDINFFERSPYMDDFSEYNVLSKRGFLRLNLLQDFLHTEYPQALLKSVVGRDSQLENADLINEPYTPKLKNTSLFYVSSERIPFGANQYNATIEHFYHVTPFGYQQMEIDMVSEVFLLPQFYYAADVADDIKFTQGNLYIGLKDAKPEQKVNILFQVLDGSGDNRYAPPDVEWDYLINNEWIPFQPFEIEDHTRADESSKKSLLKSGIIEFTLPKSISSDKTTLLNPAYLWIRACAHEEPLPADINLTQATPRIAALPDLVAVTAQAGLAQFEDQGNSLNHLAAPLPGKTISKFMDSRAAIKTVSQPYNSFDGRMPENDYQFYRRISERLRHKNRAVCIWDYERLVLEQFPALYKVKCLNHTSILENIEIAPGFVSIAVIPDLRNRNTANTTEPRVPIGVLDDIKAFLKTRTNLFVASPSPGAALSPPKPDYLQVVNPLYEQLKVTCCVRFYQGLDPAYYKYVLNSDLKNFLAPWAYNANSEISFGFAYHKSAIFNFIEERKYIDVVLDFKVQHFKDEAEQTPIDSDWIIPTTSRSVLTTVSTADNSDYEHDISIASYIEDEPCKDCDDEAGTTKVLPAIKKVKQ